jgi:hypothetical protein
MPTPEEIELPTDLQVRMAMIYYDKHMKEYENLKALILLHETELAFLWGAVVVLGCIVAWQTYSQRSKKVGSSNGTT